MVNMRTTVKIFRTQSSEMSGDMEGAVMTDWYAVGGMIAAAGGRENKHPAGLASGCIHAGNDLVMPGMEADFEEMLSAVDNPEAKYPIEERNFK